MPLLPRVPPLETSSGGPASAGAKETRGSLILRFGSRYVFWRAHAYSRPTSVALVPHPFPKIQKRAFLRPEHSVRWGEDRNTAHDGGKGRRASRRPPPRAAESTPPRPRPRLPPRGPPHTSCEKRERALDGKASFSFEKTRASELKKRGGTATDRGKRTLLSSSFPATRKVLRDFTKPVVSSFLSHSPRESTESLLQSLRRGHSRSACPGHLSHVQERSLESRRPLRLAHSMRARELPLDVYPSRTSREAS